MVCQMMAATAAHNSTALVSHFIKQKKEKHITHEMDITHDGVLSLKPFVVFVSFAGFVFE